jgi:hypothetical protein
MTWLVDEYGRVVEPENETPEALQALTSRGYRIASDADLAAYDRQLQVDELAASQGFSAEAMALAANRTAAGAAELLGGRPAEEAQPEAFGPEARLQAQAFPFSSGVGQALIASPAAIAAGAAAATGVGAVAPALAATGAGILTEAGIEAAAQEYEDAWLARREFDAGQLAQKTLLFAAGDVLFRGAGYGASRALTGARRLASAPPAPTKATGPALFEADITGAAAGAAEQFRTPAQRAAEAARAPTPAGSPVARSAGAAAARDYVDEVSEAITKMSDDDAELIARDALDYQVLAANSAADHFEALGTQINTDLGLKAKLLDWQDAAAQWTPEMLADQADYFERALAQKADQAREAMARTSVDLGAGGKRLGDILDRNLDAIRAASDEGLAFERLGLLDSFKRELDQLSNRLDEAATRGSLDPITHGANKNALKPLREGLRKDLENVDLFGQAAELQQGINAGYTQLLKGWQPIQRMFFDVIGRNFDTVGADRAVREVNVPRMLQFLKSDPRLATRLGKHLEDALDGLERMMDTRLTSGYRGLEGVEALREHLSEFISDVNFAGAVTSAEARVAHLAKAPKSRAAAAAGEVLGLVRQVPGVGQVAGIPEALGRAAGHLRKGVQFRVGSPVGQLFDKNLSRYAASPLLQNPSTASHFAPWVLDALVARGAKGKLPDPPLGAPPAMPPVTPAPDGAPRVQVPGGTVDITIAGKSISQLGAIEGQGMRPSSLEYLRKSPEFARTGRVSATDEGVKLEIDLPFDEWDAMDAGRLPDASKAQLYLRDGRHRITVARELGRDTVYGAVKDWNGNTVFRGDIPIAGVAGAGIAAGSQLLGEDDGQGSAAAALGLGLLGGRFGRDVARSALGVAGTSAAELTDRALQLTGAVDQARAELRAQGVEPSAGKAASLAYARALRAVDDGAQGFIQRRAHSIATGSREGKRREPFSSFIRNGKDIERAYTNTMARLAEMAADPDTELATLDRRLGGLPRSHPQFAGQIAAQVQRVVSYLQATMPQPVGRSAVDPEGFPPPLGDILAGAARYEGAANPRGTIEDVAAGSAHPLQVEALRDVWPALYEELRWTTGGELLGLFQRGTPPPHERVRALDTLLDLGGVLGPGYSEGLAVAFEEARAEEPEAIGSPDAPSVAQGFRTRAQSAALDRAG